jgi:hypothetical protein
LGESELSVRPERGGTERLTKSDIKKLAERVDEVSRRLETDIRKGPTPWFDFHAPVHSYDPPNVKFDFFNRNAWEYFCYLQMKPIDWDEYVAISIWNADNNYPLVSRDASPEQRSQAETFRNRCKELEENAQHCAEELDRKDPEAYPRWKEFYRQLTQLEKENQDQQVSDEPAEVADDSFDKGIRLLWAWRSKVLEVYRKYEKLTIEEQAVHKQEGLSKENPR